MVQFQEPSKIVNPQKALNEARITIFGVRAVVRRVSKMMLLPAPDTTCMRLRTQVAAVSGPSVGSPLLNAWLFFGILLGPTFETPIKVEEVGL